MLAERAGQGEVGGFTGMAKNAWLWHGYRKELWESHFCPFRHKYTQKPEPSHFVGPPFPAAIPGWQFQET